MRNNRPAKRRSNRFRVLTFDDAENKTPSLTDYFSSLKTWFKPSSSGNPKEAASTSGEVQKSKSCSAVSIGSISNSLLRKYTRSRTLSMEDLKRLFLINNVFSLEKLQPSQIFSKKRSARTKVKKGEEFLNKWDRDIKVLYNCESNKFPRKGPRHPPATSSSESSVPISSSSTIRSSPSGNLGLLIDPRNYDRKQHQTSNGKEPCFCDYRNNFCTSKKVCPCYDERSPREEREIKPSQNRGSCYSSPRRKETGNICTCCLPMGKLDTKTHYADTHAYTNKNVYSSPKHKADHGNTQVPTSCSPQRKEVDPRTDNTNTQTFCKQKEAEPKGHPAECRYPKSADNALKHGRCTDYAKTQTTTDFGVQSYCPNHKPRADQVNTQNTFNDVSMKCLYSHEKEPKMGRKTNPANIQTTIDACAQYCRRKPTNIKRTASPRTKADYNNTQTINNEHACNCGKKIERNTQTSQKYACDCFKQTQTRPKVGLAETQTAKIFTCGCPKKTQVCPLTEIANTQTNKKYTYGCSKKMQATPRTDYANTQTANDTCTQCCCRMRDSVAPKTVFTCTNTQASNIKYCCGCSKQHEVQKGCIKTQTSNDTCTQCRPPMPDSIAPKTDYTCTHTQASNNKYDGGCSKQKEVKIGCIKTQTSNDTCTQCRPPMPDSIAPKKDYTCTHTQASNNKYDCGCSKQKEVKIGCIKTQTANDTCTQCCSPMPDSIAPKTDFTCTHTQASNNKYDCGCPKRKEVKIGCIKTQTANDTCTQCCALDQNPSGPVTDCSKSHKKSKSRKQRKHSPNRKICPKTGSANIQTSNHKLSNCSLRRNEASFVESYTSTQTLINLFTCGCSKQNGANVDTTYAYTQTSNPLCACRKAKEHVSETDFVKLNTTENSCACRNPNKSEAYNQAYIDHNRLKTYFGKLRKRNLEVQRQQTAARRRLEATRMYRDYNFPTNEALYAAQPTSQARREAALSAMKSYPESGTLPIFPDSSPSSTDTAYQPPFMRTPAYLSDTVDCSTSRVKHPGTCPCPYRIKKHEIMPSRKRKYILYHNNLRGWLAKPLRRRQLNRPGVKLAIRRRGRSCNFFGSSCVRDEIHCSPAGKYNSNCNRLVHNCDCYKCRHKCSCSSSSPENSCQKCSCGNPDKCKCFVSKKACRNIHRNNCSTDPKCVYSYYAHGNNVNNLYRNRKCTCPVCSKRENINVRCNDRNIQRNSQCASNQPCACIRDADGNIVDPCYLHSRQRCMDNKPCFIRRSFHKFCTCWRKPVCKEVAPCNDDDPHCPYLKPGCTKNDRCGINGIHRFCNCFGKADCDNDPCYGDDPCYPYSRTRYGRNNHCDMKGSMRGYGDCFRDNCGGADCPSNRYSEINRCDTRRNPCNFRETGCNDPCDVGDPYCGYPRPRCRKSGFRRGLGRLCSCFGRPGCDDDEPQCSYSQPYCTRRNPCCESCNCYSRGPIYDRHYRREFDRRYRRGCDRRYRDCLFDYDWMGCDTSDSCCGDCCRGCGSCCRAFWFTIAAIICCPIIVLWLILHDLLWGFCWW